MSDKLKLAQETLARAVNLRALIESMDPTLTRQEIIITLAHTVEALARHLVEREKDYASGWAPLLEEKNDASASRN